jgi:menaquinol-cytochrome c reductase iron-sulfur subunit
MKQTEIRDMPDASAQDPPINRRRFLKWMSGIGAALSAIIVGAPAVSAFFSPAFKKPIKKRWLTVADDVSTLDIGTPIKIDFVEAANDAWVESRTLRTVWLYTEDGEKFTAYSGVCTHLGCSYAFDKENKRFDCPCHHGLFDMKTGAVIGGPPPRPLDTLPVRVEDGEVQVIYQLFRTGISQKVEV